MSHAIHILTHFSDADIAVQAQRLVQALSSFAAVTLWEDSSQQLGKKLGAVDVSPFSGRMPHGGTLILLGTHFLPGIWLDYAKPKRLIVICMHPNATQTFAVLTKLERPSLPNVELVFASHRLQEMLGLPGLIGCDLIDLTRFKPTSRTPNEMFTIGRHDSMASKLHHHDDPSLYQMLAWSGVRTNLLGANCLSAELNDVPEIVFFSSESVPTELFLSQLDCFFFRRKPSRPDASGSAVMEALASGLPVIAHDSGAYAKWIEQGENGYLFTHQEEAFGLLVRLKDEPEKRRQMGSAARASAERLASEEKQGAYLRWLSA